MRPGGWTPVSLSSAMPLRMTCREMPVARETAETPPRPIAALSDAATSRRDRSSRTPRTAAKRRVIAATSIILSRIGQTTMIWKCYFITSPKLDYLSDWNHRRVSIERRLRAAAAGTRFVFPDRDFASYVAHLCVVRHPRRDWVRRQLEQRGIGTAIHYPVLDHKQASMQAVAFRSTDLSTTESVHPEILSLPCFPELTSEEVDRVCEALRVVE